MPKIVQYVEVYNGERYLPITLNLGEVVDKLVVIEGGVRGHWQTTGPRSVDATLDIIEEARKAYPEVVLVQKDDWWDSKGEQKSAGLQYIDDGDWILITDYDEHHRPEDIVRVRELMDEFPEVYEFIPIFLHFHPDYEHVEDPSVVDPDPGVPGAHPKSWVSVYHQRLVKKFPGAEFRSHYPTIRMEIPGVGCVDITRRCECSPFRMIVGDWYVYHFSNTVPWEYRTQKFAWYQRRIRGRSYEESISIAKKLIETPPPLLKYDGYVPDGLPSSLDYPSHVYESRFREARYWRDVLPYTQRPEDICIMVKEYRRIPVPSIYVGGKRYDFFEGGC